MGEGWIAIVFGGWVFASSCGDGSAIFEQPSAQIPVPKFAEAFELTVGELFGWLDT